MRRAVGAVALVALLFAVASTRLFLLPPSDVLLPPSDAVQRVDAVAVLSGGDERLDIARRLMQEGVATTLAVSVVGAQPSVCQAALGFPVVCFRPRPANTAGEARQIAHLADARGWDRVAIVTSSYHVVRAGLLARQCVAGEVRMVDAGWRSELPRLAGTILGEWPALLAAMTVGRAC